VNPRWRLARVTAAGIASALISVKGNNTLFYQFLHHSIGEGGVAVVAAVNWASAINIAKHFGYPVGDVTHRATAQIMIAIHPTIVR
jgi:hypothetical protein